MSLHLGIPYVILDACCGGRMWWWDKNHPLATYMDIRESKNDKNKTPNNPNWSCVPDIIGDFRDMPFEDESFHLVLFDPPHIVRPNPSGEIATKYGALQAEDEQETISRGFAECWRVLAPGGTLAAKWAGPTARFKPHFPATPVVGTRSPRDGKKLGTKWYIFYKPLHSDVPHIENRFR